MTINEVVKGRIVVVIIGNSFGNKTGTITKILSKPGALSDKVFRVIGKAISDGPKNWVFCRPHNHSYSTILYNKQEVALEYISDLRYATPAERELYNQGLTHVLYLKGTSL